MFKMYLGSEGLSSILDTDAFFSQLLTGSNTNRVAASAVATLKDVINMSNVAIWSQDEIDLGKDSIVYGSVYSHSNNFDFHSTVTITGEKLSQGQSMPNYSHLLETSYSKTVRISKSFLDVN